MRPLALAVGSLVDNSTMPMAPGAGMHRRFGLMRDVAFM